MIVGTHSVFGNDLDLLLTDKCLCRAEGVQNEMQGRNVMKVVRKLNQK